MIKTELHKTCLLLAEEKIRAIGDSISDAREAAISDTKSSMGDKYETTREMMSIEIQKLQKQLSDAQQQLLILKQIDPAKICVVAESGALIQTDSAWFYLAAALGKVQSGEESAMVISLQSPLGKLLQGRKKGDRIVMNGVTYQLLNIF